MNLNIKRETDDNNGVLISTNGAYIAFICTGLTTSDHDMVKTNLMTELDMECNADLYYTRNLTSIFIFDAETLGRLTSNTIKGLIPDISHLTYYDGAVYGNLNDVNVVSSKKELKVRKKFKTLLTIRRGWKLW